MTGAVNVMGLCAFSFSIVIAADTTNYNWTTALTGLGWDGITPVVGTLTINTGVYVYATSTGNYGLTQGGAFPSGSVPTLSVLGSIHGQGGAGGAGGSFTIGANGSPGGPALLLQSATIITGNGSIFGGGGGGGGAGANNTPGPGGAGGGGGAGKSPGAGGAGGNNGTPGNPGNTGGTTTGGTGGSLWGTGGNGGNSGASGTAGSNDIHNGGSGGANGLGVQGYSLGDWSGFSGTILGGTAG